MTLAPAWAAVTASKKLPDGAQFTVDGGTLRVQFWSPEIVRVTYAAAAELPALKSLSVVATPAKVRLTRQENGQAFTLATPRVKVRIDKQTGAVSFLDTADHVLLREAADGRRIAPATVAGAPVTSCAQSFETAADEGIYGLGQHQRGVWNYTRRRHVRLAQANTDVGVPVMTSSKGYMLLWDNPAVTTISSSAAGDTNASQKVLRWSSECGKAIDYYFCYGDGTIDAAMKAYRHLTGDAPLMPEWELGFWQCKERYASQEELLGVATKLRELKVPVDGIIQDWQYWPPGTNTWGSHLFDPTRYPDPVGMFKELHEMHYHALISVWAKFDLGSDNSKELNAVGGMFPQVTRYVSPPGQGQWYDPFAAVGRQTYWKQMRDQLFAKGADGWWLDAPEPEINGMGFRNYTTPVGPGYDRLQRLSADALDGHLPGTAGRHRSEARRHPHPFGLRRPAAQQRHHLVGRHHGNLAGFQKSNSGRTQFLPFRHPVLEYRHRRVLRQPRNGQRHPHQSALSGIFRALVPVQRLLPHVPRAWFLWHEARQGILAVRRQDPGHPAELSGFALSSHALSLLDGLAGDFRRQHLHAAAGHGFSEGPASDRASATNIFLARRSW